MKGEEYSMANMKKSETINIQAKEIEAKDKEIAKLRAEKGRLVSDFKKNMSIGEFCTACEYLFADHEEGCWLAEALKNSNALEWLAKRDAGIVARAKAQGMRIAIVIIAMTKHDKASACGEIESVASNIEVLDNGA